MGQFLLNHWMAFTGIGSVTIALIVACFFIPMLGPILSSLFSPIASALGNWFALWMGDLASGLRLMLSSVAGIIFMLSVTSGAALIAHWYWPSDNVKTALADLHKNYICQPRPHHKKYVTTWYDPWTWIF